MTPTTYSDVPRLGPPLPGDLGKPILEHQQSAVSSIDPAGQQLQQAQAAERERQLSELKAALESGVLVQNRQWNGAAEAQAVATPASTTAAAETPKLSLDAANDPNAQGHKAEFVAGLDPKGDVNPHALTPLPSPYTLSAGIWRDNSPNDRFGPMPAKFAERRCELRGAGLILPASAPIWATKGYTIWEEADAAAVATNDATAVLPGT